MAAAILGMTAGAANGQAPETPAGSEAAAPAVESRLLFAIIYSPGPKWQQGKPFREQAAIKEHYSYMKGLFAKGQTFSAGGLGADRGLVLLHARNQAEADSIVAADPMVQAGVFIGLVERYSPSFLSDQPLALTKE